MDTMECATFCYDTVGVENGLNALVSYHYLFEVLFQLMVIAESMRMKCLCLDLDVKWTAKYLVYLLARVQPTPMIHWMKLMKKMFHCRRYRCFQNFLWKRASDTIVEMSSKWNVIIYTWHVRAQTSNRHAGKQFNWLMYILLAF